MFEEVGTFSWTAAQKLFEWSRSIARYGVDEPSMSPGGDHCCVDESVMKSRQLTYYLTKSDF